MILFGFPATRPSSTWRSRSDSVASRSLNSARAALSLVVALRRRSSAARTAASRASSSNGFSKKSAAPSFIASTASGMSPWPVMTMTGNVAAALAQPPQQLDAAHIRHSDIGDDAARSTRSCARPGMRWRCRRSGPRSSGRSQQKRQRIARRIVVVDDMHDGISRHRRLPPCSTLRSVKRKIVPPPGFGSAQIRPPCASTMVREIDRPTPMPCCLVVTNG